MSEGMYRVLALLCLITIGVQLVSIAKSLRTLAAPPMQVVMSNHNDAGGYVDACGELPGMLGDDC